MRRTEKISNNHGQAQRAAGAGQSKTRDFKLQVGDVVTLETNPSDDDVMIEGAPVLRVCGQLPETAVRITRDSAS